MVVSRALTIVPTSNRRQGVHAFRPKRKLLCSDLEMKFPECSSEGAKECRAWEGEDDTN